MPDKAIVIGISHYPKLGRNGTEPNDLPGAVYDAGEMANWLANRAGAEVTTITSTGIDGRPWEVGTVRPGISDVHDAFRPYATATDRTGDRLYVYMAGHGFAPDPRSRCLILADAIASNPAWLPNFDAPSWIDWFAMQTQFDEFVLWMDCCGTQGLDYARGVPPVERKSTRATAAKVFMAFASANGRDAYEGPVDTTGIVRGYFTDRLLEGLNGGAANADTTIRSGSLARYLRNGGAESLAGDSERSPPRPAPEVPHEHDMVFPSGNLPTYTIHVRDSAGRVPANGTVVTVSRPGEPYAQSALVSSGTVGFALPLGVFKLTGPGISRLFEIGAATPPQIDAP